MYTPSQDIIKTIFGSILSAHIANVEPKLAGLSEKLVDAMIKVFNKILRDTLHFSPSSRKFHYQFNFRELAKICEGVCRSTQ
jgi:dynein heavy chain